MASDPIREDGVGRDVLEARAVVLEAAVAKQPGMTAETIAAHRPGGVENRDPSAMGWLTYLCWLHSAYAKGPAVPSTSAATRWDARAMDDMRAALAAEPVYLTLSSGRTVAVHPKGEHALHRLAVGQIALRWLTERRLALMLEAETNGTPAVIDLLYKATAAEAHLQAEFVAIVTHAGAGVPWPESGSWTQPVPLWMRDELTTADLVAIQRAHLEVNLLRINAIADRSRSFASGGDPMPLAAFLGVMAEELKVRPEEMARRYSLGEVFAMSYAKFEAHERAKAKADADRPAATR